MYKIYTCDKGLWICVQAETGVSALMGKCALSSRGKIRVSPSLWESRPCFCLSVLFPIMPSRDFSVMVLLLHSAAEPCTLIGQKVLMCFL